MSGAGRDAQAGAAATAAAQGGAGLDRADLFYCLARAFMPPPPQWSVCDWARPLADDLGELTRSLALDGAPALSALDAACRQYAEGQSLADSPAEPWLVEYARLFLTPPAPVPLNTGLYLEGAVGGTAAQMMRSCYETAGVVPSEHFHDLPDHVAMQLEFLARLHERAARGEVDAGAMAEEFAAEFVRAWVEPLQQACAAAAARWPAAQVYGALAGLAGAAA